MAHIPVLLDEAINFLQPEKGQAFIDATANGGGHTEEILKKMTSRGVLVAVDRDERAIEILKKKFAHDLRFKAISGNFRNLKKLASQFSKTYDGILFDLGMSSNQLEKSGRGFSFQKDEPLIMTYEAKFPTDQLTAAEIVNTWPEEKLAEIFWEYGQERRARKIARVITRERRLERILSSRQLAEIIAHKFPQRVTRIHPATKIFQALRIAVNDELAALEEGLVEAWDILGQGGRLVAISFHSLEDRIVKRFFSAKGGSAKPLHPSRLEIQNNPRSRSAKLRALIKFKI